MSRSFEFEGVGEPFRELGMRNGVSEVMGHATGGIPAHASALRIYFAPHFLGRPRATIRLLDHDVTVRCSSVGG